MPNAAPISLPRWRTALAVTASLLATLSATTAAGVGESPRAADDDDGRVNETVLFSRDVDRPRNVSLAGNGSGPALADVAVGTDITYTRPPPAAARWTRRAYSDVRPGSRDVSVAPADATLEDGRFIKDAHASAFAVTPSTRAHERPGGEQLYVAPQGTVRGLVDYRIRVPEDTERVDWSLLSHRVQRVRLVVDGRQVATGPGTHRPVFDYRLDRTRGRTSLSLVATVRVRLRRETVPGPRREGVPQLPGAAVAMSGGPRPVAAGVADRPGQPAGDLAAARTTTVEETLTVRGRLPVVVYRPQATVYTARYPDGDVALAVYHPAPWQGARVTAPDSPGPTLRVRGVWRFYTARDPAWLQLRRHSEGGTAPARSGKAPLLVHAYPSRVGPRAEPTDRLQLRRVWGADRRSPAATIGEHVAVEVVERPYRPSFGVAVRSPRIDPDALLIRGIVRGVTADVDRRRERTVRAADLSVSILVANDERARLLVELRDAETGAPIRLTEPPIPRYQPVTDAGRDGYVTVAGQRVRTNASGMATVTVTEPGVYTARYEPDSWLAYDPAYAPTSATTRWHPLTTAAGWLALAIATLRAAVPFLLVWYAGRKLGRILGAEVRR